MDPIDVYQGVLNVSSTGILADSTASISDRRSAATGTRNTDIKKSVVPQAQGLFKRHE